MNPKDDPPKKPESFNFNRRDFLKSAGVGSLVTAVSGVAETEAQNRGSPADRTGRNGLATDNTLHPVQQAFCDADAMMCGFCTPGFVMATVGFLKKHPNATPEQIRKGLDGNICRCGTFVRVFETALKATVVVEGNHYFAPQAVHQEHIRKSHTHTTCHWKGEASYYDIVVGTKVNADAAWYYPAPKDAAKEIKDYVAFWKGVQVSA